MEIKIYENIERAKIYCREITFSFIEEFLPNGKKFIHNGFIKEVKTDILIFFDVINKREIPIALDKCSISVSKHNDLSQEMAREIMWEFYKKEGVDEGA